jgi:hypothetical protein
VKGKAYVENLERIVRQMMTPLREVPLPLVIEALSGHRVLPFDRTDSRDAKLLDDLIQVAQAAGREINRVGIQSKRPNEVGNYIEPFVKDALDKRGLKADTPTCQSGKKKAAGYPDITFLDRAGRPHYLECKSFNISNIDTTQRAFYLSPSDDCKITEDAHHLIMSYEMAAAGRKGAYTIYRCNMYKLLSIDKMVVDVKYEFNCDNRRMYAQENLLAEGEIR